MSFETSKSIVLLNGGYINNATTKKPVTHKGFVTAQNRAHYLVTLAARMKGKTFTVTEALAFCGAKEEESDAEALNAKLQEFKILAEFEAEGLFFTNGITKLNKIYKVSEIVKAAKTVYAVLNA